MLGLDFTPDTISHARMKELRNFDAIKLPPDAIVISDKSPSEYQCVHFSIDAAHISTIGNDLKISRFDLQREAEYYWVFSKNDSSGFEDYSFSSYPSNVMRTPRRAGSAAGPFAAHAYRTSGEHTVSVLFYFRGYVYECEKTINVQARNYGVIGLWDPDDTAQGVTDFEAETGLTVAAGQTFTDIDAALRAIHDDVIDTLACRRGAARAPLYGRSVTKASYNVGTSQAIIGFGGAAGDRINLRLAYGETRDSAAIFKNPIRLTEGDGSTQTFDTSVDISTVSAAVYVDNVLQVEGADYTVSPTSITFTTAPQAGHVIRVIYVDSSGGLKDVTYTFEVFRLSGDGLLRDLDIDGGYRADEPGAFDPADLSTVQHALSTAGVRFDNAAGATVFGCKFRGLRTGVGFQSACDTVGVIDTEITDWNNYGFFGDRVYRACLVGNAIYQNLGAFNYSGKNHNLANNLNTADHGPIRCPDTVQMVINRNYLTSRNDWTKGAWVPGAQPIMRLPQSEMRNPSAAISENTAIGGSSMMAGGASPNEWIVMPKGDVIHHQNNMWIATDVTAAGAGGKLPISSINDYFLIRPRSDFTIAGVDQGADRMAPADVRTDPDLFLNPTIVLDFDSPDADVSLFQRAVCSTTGISCVVSQEAPGSGDEKPFVVTTAGAVQTVPIKHATYSTSANQSYRIFYLDAATAAGLTDQERELAATGFATVSAQEAVFAPTGDENKEASKSDTSVTVDRIDGGSFGVGDLIWVCAQTTIERSPGVDADGNGIPLSTAETWPLDQLAEPLRLDPTIVTNPLVIITGNLNTFRLREDDTPITDLTPYRPDTIGSLSPLFQPLAGSTAIETQAAEPGRDMTGATRVTVTKGALTESADLSAWPPHPVAAGGASVALIGEPYEDGEALTTGSNVTYSIATPGTPPAQEVSTFLEVTRGGIVLPLTESLVVEEGDEVCAVLDYRQELVGRKRVRSVPTLVRPLGGYTLANTLVAHYDMSAATPGGIVDGAFASFTDLSGNGNDATQADPSLRPLSTTVAEGAAARFIGRYIDVPNSTLNTLGLTIFVAMRSDPSTPEGQIFCTNWENRLYLGLNGDGDVSVTVGDPGTGIGPVPLGPDAVGVIAVKLDPSGDAVLWVNGASMRSAWTPDTDNYSGTNFGSYDRGKHSFIEMHLFEAKICSAPLTDQQIAQEGAALAAKWRGVWI